MMGVPRLPTALLLAACVPAVGQQPVVPAPSPPAARLAPLHSGLQPESPPPPFAESVVPGIPQGVPVHPLDRPPSPAYLPKDAQCGGCDGDCHPCRRSWIDMSFFVGQAENLPYVDRKYIFGFGVGGGYWLDEDRVVGIQSSFFDAHGSYREMQAGPMLVDSPMTLFTVDSNLRAELFTIEHFRFDGLVGYRYAQHREKLLTAFDSTVNFLGNRTHIHGGQVGLVTRYRYGAYFAEAVGKVALARTSADIDINGLRTIEDDRCYVAEFGIRAAYQLGQALWLTAGYTSIFLSNIDRPDQLNTNYFLHGLSIGFEKRF